MDEKDANNNLAAEENNAPIQEESIWSQNPTSTATPTSEPAPIVEKPKKKKLGLIITLCALAVLLIGGGVFAALYLSWRQSDTTIVLDAITGIIKEPKAAITGTIDIKASDTTHGFKSIRIALDSATDATNGFKESISGTIVVTATDDKEFTAVISGAFISEGTLFIKIDGIRSALNSLELPTEVDSIMKHLDDLVDDIDGKWYKITAADLSFNTDAKETFSCIVDASTFINSEDSLNEIASLYTDSPFVVPTKQNDNDSSGNAVYNIIWDADYLANFMNTIQGSEAFKKVKSCGDLLDDMDKQFTAKDFELPEDMPKLNLHIDSWSHELRGISASHTKDGISATVDLTLLYGDKVNVQIPENAKSISDLMDSIEDAIKKVVSSMLEQQVIDNCAKYTGDTHANCISTYSSQIQYYLDQMDLEDLFSITTGNRI